jgi:hypothetical protein
MHHLASQCDLLWLYRALKIKLKLTVLVFRPTAINFYVWINHHSSPSSRYIPLFTVVYRELGATYIERLIFRLDTDSERLISKALSTYVYSHGCVVFLPRLARRRQRLRAGSCPCSAHGVGRGPRGTLAGRHGVVGATAAQDRHRLRETAARRRRRDGRDTCASGIDGKAKKASQSPKKAATARKSQTSGGATRRACTACRGAHRAHTCGKAAQKRAAPKKPVSKAAAKNDARLSLAGAGRVQSRRRLVSRARERER